MTMLAGKVVVITGAGGGIGSATAALLAERGARVVAADIHLPGAERVAAEIAGNGGKAIAVRVDITEEQSIVAMMGAAIASFGRIDAIDNNAADLAPELVPLDGDIEHMSVEVWDRAFRANTRGTMLCCKHALPHLMANGGGAIVNIASNLALQGNIIQAAYAASKAAILQLTRSIAASHGPRGVRCNAVSPGLTLSPGVLSNLPARLREIMESETPNPRLGLPAEIASVVAFLVSDDASNINGHNLVADGGFATHVPGYAALRTMMAGE
jgi:NAD(P)-dependent dehydrogenase (short-subunit alcohol dehydrogenase family)